MLPSCAELVFLAFVANASLIAGAQDNTRDRRARVLGLATLESP